MKRMLDLVRTVGLPYLMSARKARQWAWEDTLSVHFTTRCIQTLMAVGYFEQLTKQEWVDAKSFAATHDLDPDLLTAICDDLYSRCILRKNKNGSYAFDVKGRFLYENELSRGWFYLSHGYENVLYNLEALVRKELKYGVDLQRDGKLVALGSGLASKDFCFPLVIEKVRRAGAKCVLDVGCGDGAFLREACSKLPGVRAVGFDLSPDAVSFGNAESAKAGMSDRVVLHVGDANKLPQFAEKLAGVEAGCTFFVLHELCDGRDNPAAVRFLKAFREALPGVPFHIVETIRPTPEEMREKPGPAIEYFLFHDLSGQIPVSRESWRRIFQQAGYSSVDEDYLDFTRISIFSIR